MKCPKCGSEIKEGHLYCEKCGEEIRIVPDFDATVDEKINISFTDDIDTAGVIEELGKVATKEIGKSLELEATKEINLDLDIKQDQLSDKKPGDKLIVKALVMTGAICAVLALLGYLINTKVNNYYSVDNQYEAAFEQFEDGDYEKSIKTLKHAISISPDDIRLKILVADNYFMLEKYDESNAVLYEILNDFPEDTTIYEKIIKNNESKQDYNAINTLLEELDNDELKQKYSKYFTGSVNFSVDSGSYNEIINLELSSSDGAKIYYTLDGSEANEKSLVYTKPLEFDSGEYVVNAIAVNDFGIKSENEVREYVVDFFVPDSPVIKTKSGVYNVPTPVEVSFADYDICYYTIDGEDPTLEDEKYVGPIPMYIGKHIYKFATISNKGVSSEVVSVEITLDLIVLIDMEIAHNSIESWKAATGSTDYKYKCEQACVYNNSTYYIINEYSETSEGKELTGNHYAVDVLTGLPYRALLNKSTGQYTLEALR